MLKENTQKIDDRLLYRRQYFIGPKFVDSFPTWEKIILGKNIHITAHPDLEINTAKKGDIELALLGFMFDSQNYKSSNKNILNHIIKNDSFEEIVRATYRYAGRWILIYTYKNESKLLHDPAGLRQIFHCNIDENIWCSAQPHILAKIFNKAKRDSKDITSFINSRAFELNERSWIGDDTIYSDIYHLPPNHYLDINDNTVIRYWPNEKIQELPFGEVVESSAKILSELLKAAKNRYDTAQIITGGWDTRVLLAASKSFSEKQSYFIHKLPDMDDSHEDILIPKEIASNNNLNFDIIDCTEYDKDFDKINTQNVYLVQSDKKKFQYYNYFRDFENILIISGNVSPLIKEQYHSIDKINVTNLARLMHYQNDKLAKKAISNWLNNVKDITITFDISIESLFYWELRFGTWASMFNSELDIATEEFSPYNCRDLINIMHSVPAKYRSKPDVLLYHQIIKRLWPELLDIPINPVSYSLKNKNNKKYILIGMNLLRKNGLYRFIRYFYRKLFLR